MKRLLCLIILIFVLIITVVGCSRKDISATATDNLAIDYEPLEIMSFEGINEAKKNVDVKNDIYNLNALEFYYVPSDIITDAKLNAIRIKDRYVCIYYYLNELDFESFENSDEKEIARIENTIKLEWIRNADGGELLKNTINQLHLKQMDSDGLYYYADITYPSDPEVTLSKSIYWVEDGYMFNLDVPVDLFTENKEAGIESTSFAKLASVEKIEVITE